VNIVVKVLFQNIQDCDVVAENVIGRNLVVRDYKKLETDTDEEKKEKIFLIFVRIVEVNFL
jgi:putative NADH-flavin reductase